MALTEYDRQLLNELALIKYGKLSFNRLQEKQKRIIVNEFIKVRTLGDIDKIENYLARKRFGGKN